MNATATNTAQLVLQDSRSLLFYNKDLGGFSEPDKNKATRLDVGTSQPAFIRAHFQNPQFIVEVALEESPTPDNAHLNPHINGTLRPVKIYDNRGSRTYRFGDWKIEVCSRTHSRKQGCGFRKTVTETNFDLRNVKLGYFEYIMTGGLKAAVARIAKLEMKRHGL